MSNNFTRTIVVPSRTPFRTSVPFIIQVDNITGSAVMMDNSTNKVYASVDSGNKWVIDDIDSLLFKWNNRSIKNRSDINRSQLKAGFYSVVVPILNTVRGDLLNNDSLYESKEIANIRRSTFYKSKIPYIVDPKTDLVNQANGNSSTIFRKESIQSEAPKRTDYPDTREGAEQYEEAKDRWYENNPVATEAKQRENDGAGSLITTPNPTTPSNSDIRLRYPLNFADASNMDFIDIGIFKYVPSFDFNSGRGGGGTEGGPNRTGDRFTEKIGSISLPMQPNLSSTNSVSFDEDNLNPLQLAAGGAIMKGLTGDAKGAAESFGTLATTESMTAASSYYAGKAIGKSLLGRARGQVINNNLELLFKGPRMRIFNFTFRLTPRSEEEGKEIRKIIKTFKKYMSPGISSGNLFLNSPHVFQLNYQYNDNGTFTDHPYLNKFKPCVLSNFVNNFTPDGSYATYENGSLTQYEITMVFEEIEPIYENEYDLTKDDMGL